MAEKLFPLSSAPQYIEASSWNVISLIAPSTVSQNPANLEAFSDVNNSFNGLLGGKRSIVYFAKALPAGNYLFMPWNYNGYIRSAMQYHKTFADHASFSPALTDTYSLRIRPIIAQPPASVAPNLLSWNAFNNGAPYTFDTSLILTQSAQDGFNLTTTTTGVVADTGVYIGFHWPPQIQLLMTNPLYGFVIDVQINVSSSQWIIDGQSASLVAPVPSGGTNRHIYGLKMSA